MEMTCFFLNCLCVDRRGESSNCGWRSRSLPTGSSIDLVSFPFGFLGCDLAEVEGDILIAQHPHISIAVPH